MAGDTLTAKLQSLPASDIRTAFILAALLAALNAVRVIWESVDVMHRMRELSEAGLCTLGMTLPYRDIRVGFFLVIAVIGLRRRKSYGFYLSLLSLSAVIAEYWCWYLKSQQMLIDADIPHFPSEIPHAFNLYRARDWHVFVLLISGVLLIWEVRVLSSALLSCRRRKDC